MAKRQIAVKKRGASVRKSKPVYLIVAEGKNKTETLYFSNYQEQGRPYSIRFVRAGNRTDAESLYKTLKSKWKELDLSSENGDRGFIVLDMDNDAQKEASVLELMRDNNNNAIEFIVSNPTFEVWFLLHFKYTTKEYSNGDAVISDLKKYVPEYEKNRDIYRFCSQKITDAMSNSDRLVKYFGDKAWPSISCNPRTDVSRLVKLLEQNN